MEAVMARAMAKATAKATAMAMDKDFVLLVPGYALPDDEWPITFSRQNATFFKQGVFSPREAIN
jgi:hypothetical protein